MGHPVQEIPRLLQGKGWGLFPRPSRNAFTVEESVAQGAADEIRSGVPYDLLPRVSSKEELDRVFDGEDFLPVMTLPRGIAPDEVTRQIRDMAVHLHSGTRIRWMILEVEEAAVALYERGIGGPKIVMPLRIFLRALSSMTDITGRLPKEARLKSRR